MLSLFAMYISGSFIPLEGLAINIVQFALIIIACAAWMVYDHFLSKQASKGSDDSNDPLERYEKQVNSLALNALVISTCRSFNDVNDRIRDEQ